MKWKKKEAFYDATIKANVQRMCMNESKENHLIQPWIKINLISLFHSQSCYVWHGT